MTSMNKMSERLNIQVLWTMNSLPVSFGFIWGSYVGLVLGDSICPADVWK